MDVHNDGREKERSIRRNLIVSISFLIIEDEKQISDDGAMTHRITDTGVEVLTAGTKREL